MKGSCYDSPQTGSLQPEAPGEEMAGPAPGRAFPDEAGSNKCWIDRLPLHAVPSGVAGSVYQGRWCLHSVCAPSHNFSLYGEMD